MNQKFGNKTVFIFSSGDIGVIRIAAGVEDSFMGFCLNDVADATGIDRKSLRKSIPDSCRFQCRAPTQGGEQWMSFITPGGLSCIIRSLPPGRTEKLLRHMKEIMIPAISGFLNVELSCLFGPEDEETLEEATFHRFSGRKRAQGKDGGVHLQSHEIIIRIQKQK